jgi:hypothetical protein
MNELKRFELILKQDVSESIIVEEKEGKINVDCKNFSGIIDLDKIILDDFDNGEFLKNSTFVLGDNTELIAEYQKININFGSNCLIYVNTEESEEEQTEQTEVRLIGKDNNVVKTGKNSIINLNNDNEIYSNDNCEIIVNNDNFIEIINEVGKDYIDGKIDIVAGLNSRIILPMGMNSKTEKNIIVRKNSFIYPKGYNIMCK